MSHSSDLAVEEMNRNKDEVLAGLHELLVASRNHETYVSVEDLANILCETLDVEEVFYLSEELDEYVREENMRLR